jgi:hypothetical protein
MIKVKEIPFKKKKSLKNRKKKHLQLESRKFNKKKLKRRNLTHFWVEAMYSEKLRAIKKE